MTIHLPKDLENSVRAEVLSGRFASADDAVAEIVRAYFHHRQEEHHHRDVPAADPPPPPGRKPLWERAADLRKSIPAEEWDKLPADGSKQLDHYIHGSPSSNN